MSRTIYPGTFDQSIYGIAISSNLSSRIQTVDKHGYNPDIDTGAYRDIWDISPYADYEYATAASSLGVSSSSANDSPAGVGVSVVRIFGLNELWQLDMEDVTMSGVTIVPTIKTFIRVYSVKCVETGIGTENAVAAGTITVTNTDEAIVQAVIIAGNTSTKMSHFTIPDGFTGFINSRSAAGGPNDDFVVDYLVKLEGGIFYTFDDVEISNSNIFISKEDPPLGPIPSKTDIKISAIGVTNNGAARVKYSVMLIENEYLAELARAL